MLIGFALSWSAHSEHDMTEQQLNTIEQKYNKFARQRVIGWQQLIQDNQDLPEQEKLNRVNAFFNANVQFIND